MTLRLIALATTLGALGACGPFGSSSPLHDSGPDAGDVDSGVAAPILVLSDERLLMPYASSAEVKVLLLEDGATPVAGREVRFTLHGRANDSSLSDFGARTDAAGAASVTLHSGLVESTFSLRVAADGFEPAHVSVTVSAGDLGALTVRPVDAPAETARHRVEVYGEVDCASERVAARDFDHTATVWRGGEHAAFPYLPLADTYAVAVYALDPELSVIALRCVDEVALEAPETALEISLGERAVEPAGAYATRSRIELGDVPATWSSILTLSLGEPAGDEVADAARLLDALEARLADLDDDAGLAALEAARPSLLVALDEALGGRGPGRSVAALAQRFGSLRALTGEGVLTVGPEGVITYAESELAWLSSEEPELAGPTAGAWAVSSEFATSVRAAATLSNDAPPSEWVSAWVAAEAGGADAIGAMLASLAGCDAFAASEPLLALGTSCDAACLHAVCEADVGDLYVSALDALDSATSSDLALEVAGSLRFRGESFVEVGATRVEGSDLDAVIHGAPVSAGATLEGTRIP